MEERHLRLVVITDRHVVRKELLDAAEAALEGGATAIMLREKDLSGDDLYRLGRTLRDLTRLRDAALIVNDRADLALAIEADAVHLGWQSLPPEAVRRAVGGRMWIGVSAHNPAEARRALDAGAEYLTYSPVFQTPSKEGVVPTVGLDGLRQAAEMFAAPLVALGGIAPENAADCLRAGAAGVAVIRAIMAADDPRAAALQFREAMK